MAFARKVWHLLVAIKDGLVLLFMLLFFLLLYAALTVRPSAAMLHDGALLLRLDGKVVEEPSLRDPLAALASSDAPAREYRARDLVRAIELAADDDHIKAVVLDLSRFTGGGQVNMEEVGAALDQVRAAKKPVLTYAVAYADDAMLLAAHASEVWVHPMGGAFVMGPGGTQPYLGGLLERLNINVHVYKVGTFKDAVEPYIRSDQSDPSRAARGALFAALWEDWKANVAKARPKARLDLVTKDPVSWIAASGGDSAKASLDAGLVDRLGDEVAFGDRVRELAGKDRGVERPGSFAHNGPAALLAAHAADSSGKPVAVVTVAGMIVDGKAGPGTAGGDRIAALIDDANADGAPALVLRVDSPGGSVLASETIRAALERFKAKGRPVAVSMANMAASGGYWVSTPGQRIFAEPGTITGSIGIFAVLPSFEKALAHYGVKADGVRTTPLSGQPDALAGFSPEVDRMLQADIESGYARFLGLVGKSRGKSTDQIDAIAQGRVWDGGTARQNGLVDQFGGLPDAVEWAAKQAGLESWHAQYYGKDADPYASLIERLTSDDEGSQDDAHAHDFAGLVALRQQQGLIRAWNALVRLGEVQGAQAYCMDCPVAAQAEVPARPQGWGGIMAGLLGLR